MRIALFVTVGLSIAGCAVGPDYESPEIVTPEDFRERIDEGASFANTEWWQVYEDTELDRLIEIALEENNEIAIATARLEEARAAFERGEKLLRQIGEKGQLGSLLCARGRLDQQTGDGKAARAALEEAAGLADEVGAGPASELGMALKDLREAIEADSAGGA